jgi:diguanylate cyclase (GGDEF)-like protein
VAARYGGEEFCLILLDSHVMGVYNTIERIRMAVEKHYFKVPGGEDFHVTISSGIASNQSPGINKIEDMIQGADAMLYAAKEGGRNKTKIHGI